MITIEVPYRAVLATRTEQWYTVNQDYYNKLPVMASVDADGNHTDLLTEAQLRKLCEIMYTFAKQVGYGLRTYNSEVTSSTGSGKPLSIHELALMLKSMPAGLDHPLAYAVNSFQAFTVLSSRDLQLRVLERLSHGRTFLQMEQRHHRGARNNHSGILGASRGSRYEASN